MLYGSRPRRRGLSFRDLADKSEVERLNQSRYCKLIIVCNYVAIDEYFAHLQLYSIS